MVGNGADADGCLDKQLRLEGILHRLGDLEQLRALHIGRDLLDDGNVRLVDAEHKVLLLVGEHILQHIHRRHVGTADLTNQKHGPLYIGGKMQFLGPDVNIARQNVVGDDVLDKGALVVLFLIIGLGAVERHIGHDAQASGRLVVAVGKHGVIKIRTPAGQRFERLLIHNDNGVRRTVELDDCVRPFLPDHGSITARNHITIRVDDADHAIGGILHLDDDALKHPTGHTMPSPSK